MWPALLPDDIVLLGEGLPRVGDIALFGDVLHRVIAIEPSGHMWERGDANAIAKRRAPDELRGVLKSIVRHGEFVDPPTRMISLADYTAIARALAQRLRRR